MSKKDKKRKTSKTEMCEFVFCGTLYNVPIYTKTEEDKKLLSKFLIQTSYGPSINDPIISKVVLGKWKVVAEDSKITVESL